MHFDACQSMIEQVTVIFSHLQQQQNFLDFVAVACTVENSGLIGLCQEKSLELMQSQEIHLCIYVTHVLCQNFIFQMTLHKEEEALSSFQICIPCAAF